MIRFLACIDSEKIHCQVFHCQYTAPSKPATSFFENFLLSYRPAVSQGMRTMELKGLGLRKLVKFICQAIYASNSSYDNFFHDKYTCIKLAMLDFEQVYLS